MQGGMEGGEVEQEEQEEEEDGGGGGSHAPRVVLSGGDRL